MILNGRKLPKKAPGPPPWETAATQEATTQETEAQQHDIRSDNDNTGE